MIHLLPSLTHRMQLSEVSHTSIWQQVREQLSRKQVMLLAWILIGCFTSLKQTFIHSYNNYLIFKYTYIHALEKVNMYLYYPESYSDSNHYGPFFAMLIAPFAVMPDWLGMLCWQLANTVFLFVAITRLPLKDNQLVLILWLCTHELLTSMLSFQFNPSIAAVIILAFTCIDRKKDFWAAFFIMLGTFVKIYGIVGLAFFFFSKQKMRFIGSLAFWAVVFFVAPMAMFGIDFIIQSYHDWYVSLVEKNEINTSLTGSTDISVMGMARRLAGDASLPNTPFILAGLIGFGATYLRTSQYVHPAYRMMLLASTLLFTVLFSSGAESPTYIIAFCGVAIWYALHPKPLHWLPLSLLILALVITSLSPSDLFPKAIRDEYIRAYSLKALPCLLILIYIWTSMLKDDFSRYPVKRGTDHS